MKYKLKCEKVNGYYTAIIYLKKWYGWIRKCIYYTHYHKIVIVKCTKCMKGYQSVYKEVILDMFKDFKDQWGTGEINPVQKSE